MTRGEEFVKLLDKAIDEIGSYTLSVLKVYSQLIYYIKGFNKDENILIFKDNSFIKIEGKIDVKITPGILEFKKE